MNAPVLLAQLSGSTVQTNPPPKNLKIEKPQNGQAVTVHLDGQTKIDFSDVASEKLTFVRIGDKLIVLFDNQSTVTLEPPKLSVNVVSEFRLIAVNGVSVEICPASALARALAT